MQGIWGQAVAASWAAIAQNERNASPTSNIDAWWACATQEAPEDAYKRLIDACRLAVEEAYTLHGELIGSYAEAAGDNGSGMRFFNNFLRTASRLGLMPPWWTSDDVTAVKKLAKDPQKSFCIMHAQEVSDVRETWGFATTLVLRSLASRVYEASLHQTGDVDDAIEADGYSDYSEDDVEDDDEDEDNYDDDDYDYGDDADEGLHMGEHNVHEEDGAEICTCKAHGLEICHLCCVDFKDINDMQREDSRLAEADFCAGPGCTSRGKGMKYCARCGRVKYCGKKCQEAHWRAGHKQACQALGASGGGSAEQGFRPRIIKASCSPRTFEELAPGTRVRLPDRSGRQPPEPLVGKILQTNMKGREEITGIVLPMYIIRYENGERDSIPVEDVHGDWEVVKESRLTSGAGHKQVGSERGGMDPPLPRAAQQADDGPGKACSVCNERMGSDGFSKRQWKLKAHERRCLACQGDGEGGGGGGGGEGGGGGLSSGGAGAAAAYIEEVD